MQQQLSSPQLSSPQLSSDLLSTEARIKNTHALTSAIERASLRQTNNNRPLAGALVLLIHTADHNNHSVADIVVQHTRSGLHRVVPLAHYNVPTLQCFGGCWGVRSERKVWRTKEWYGPWTSLFRFLHNKLNIPNDKRIHEAVFVIFAILVLYTTYHRLQTMQ